MLQYERNKSFQSAVIEELKRQGWAFVNTDSTFYKVTGDHRRWTPQPERSLRDAVVGITRSLTEGVAWDANIDEVVKAIIIEGNDNDTAIDAATQRAQRELPDLEIIGPDHQGGVVATVKSDP